MYVRLLTHSKLSHHLKNARQARAELAATRFSGVTNRLAPGMRGLLIYLGEVYRTALRRSIRWQRRYVNNRKLLALDERTLKDIGLPRSEIPFLADTLAQTETPVRQTVRDICRH